MIIKKLRLLIIVIPTVISIDSHYLPQIITHNLFTLSTHIIFTLIFGYFAINIGRKTLALCSVISIMLLSYPLFMLLKSSSFGLMVLIQLVFALCLSCIDGINMEMMASRFDRAVRVRGVGIGFTVSTAILGGTAPTICSYLMNTTGSNNAPIIFLMVAGLVALPAAMTLNQR